MWTFGGETPEAFDAHVSASIPGYRECHALVLDLVDELCPARGRCYDLGCSTGTLTRRLGERLAPRGAHVVGVDRDPDMIELARRRGADDAAVRFSVCALEQFRPEPADVIVCFYTLQFVALRERAAVLARLREALAPFGALILFEKLLAESAAEQAMADGAYAEFKRRSGFTPAEIAEKRRSLRGILQPLPATTNRRLLEEAGFTWTAPVFRWLLFEGVVAGTDPV